MRTLTKFREMFLGSKQEKEEGLNVVRLGDTAKSRVISFT